MNGGQLQRLRPAGGSVFDVQWIGLCRAAEQVDGRLMLGCAGRVVRLLPDGRADGRVSIGAAAGWPDCDCGTAAIFRCEVEPRRQF